MIVLGIETSCDETAAALVRDGRHVLQSTVASQLAVHKPFKGVVPELASRAHVERINEVVEEALSNQKRPVDAIAVTTGPGLIGCLLVGTVTARMLAWAKKIPVVGVNHLEGHLFAGLVEHRTLKPPFLGLIVSGGHTELVIFKGYGRYEKLGATRDDAAGEAFDKVANMLGLPFPGGPAIDRASRRGNPNAVAFPRAWIPGTHDFSFSGLKTSVANYLHATSLAKRAKVQDIAASFQEAVIDVLVKKTLDAAESRGLSSIVVGGGVAANSRLRAAFKIAARKKKMRVYLPDLSFCTDNAAMIAAAGHYKLKHGLGRGEKLIVDANLEIAELDVMTAKTDVLSRPIQIGSLALSHNIIVSPMVGVTDAPFRRLCARGGSALMSGEMLSAQAIRHENKKTLHFLRFFPDERPVSCQLMGSEPDIMAEASKMVEGYGADMIDVNAGCPVPKITKTKSGSALLKDEKRFAGILSAIVQAVKVPVTVKIRIGVRENEYLAPALAKLAQECGVSAVIVHARPVSKRHSGRPDWEGLRQTVEAVKIPVIGNGGVNVSQDAVDFLKISGCAGVSIGRAAIGDPGIFNRIRHYLQTGEELRGPTNLQKLETLWQHVQWAAEFFGERTGLLRLRKIVPYYVAGFPNATQFRGRANKIATLVEWEDLIDSTRRL